MNEFVFLLQTVFVVAFLLAALRLGKNYLLVLVSIQIIIANLFILKQIDLFTKTLTCTDAFIIGSVFGENLIQEYFGKKEAIKTIKISFFSMIFFLVMAKIHLLYFPSKFDAFHISYKNILSNSSYVILSSISVFFITQRLDVLLFGFLKKIFNNKYFTFRIIFSSLLIQLLDTILFSFLALRNLVVSIFDIILFSFLIKTLVIFLAAPFMKFARLITKVNYE